MLTSQPNFLKGGIVLVDAASGQVLRTLPMLINPAKLTRSFEVKSMGEERGRSAPLRLTGPAVETITLEAKLEVADALARGEASAVEEGVRPHLAVLQGLVNPTAAKILANAARAAAGALEIVPMDQPLTLFVWGPGNILPVRVAALSFTEEFFNPRLFPLSATVNLTLRVLSIDDLGVASRGGALYLAHLKAVEASAARVRDGQAARLGVEGAL